MDGIQMAPRAQQGIERAPAIVPSLVERSAGKHAGPAEAERRLRRVVAELLAVSEGEITGSVSLVEDLAADSLDLLELALRIEEAFDVTLPDRLLAGVRTYGELAALVADRVRYPAAIAAEPVLVRARVAPAAAREATVRVLVLTPYAVQIIAEDARRTGRGARVELAVPAGSQESDLAYLRRTFADLAAGGIDVQVDRDERWTA